MDLSVVIVNYNVRYFLEQCLLSVEKAVQGLKVETWVVDNASADGSVAYIQQKFPKVKVIANKDNVGFSVANNQAIRQSKGKYVLLLNPDTVVQEDTFTKCFHYMEANPKAGALGVRMIDGKGNFLPESKRGLPTPEVALYKMLGLNAFFPKSKQFGKYHLSYLDEHETNNVDVLAGAFMWMRKDALDQVGLLDEDFFMYGEDIDLSYRITLGGYHNVYFPKTTIIHYKGESTKRRTANYVRVFYKAMIQFANKHYAGTNKGILVQMIHLAIRLRATLAILQRALSSLAASLLDLTFILLILFYLKDYWEEHILFVDKYPPRLILIHFPYYVLSWMFFLWLSGMYSSKTNTVFKLFRGMGLGTVVILAIYSLFPEEYRFSRGIIVFGTVLISLGLVSWRLLYHFVKFKNFQLDLLPQKNTVIIGQSGECMRVNKLLREVSKQHDILGEIHTDKGHNIETLGDLEKLPDLVEVYQIESIIFCTKDWSIKEVMRWMGVLGDQIQYKIVPEESLYIIGSDSKNTQSEHLSQEIKLQLADPVVQQRKRLLDLVLCVMVLLLSPILLFSKKSWIKGLGKVLFNQNTWIGYSQEGRTDELPKLKPGVFPIDYLLKDKPLDINAKEQLNWIYARYYHPQKDSQLFFQILLKK